MKPKYLTLRIAAVFSLVLAVGVQGRLIPVAVAPHNLLLESDLICIAKLTLPPADVQGLYAAQAHVQSVIASVWDEEQLAAHLERTPTGTNLYILMPVPSFDNTAPALLHGGEYLFCLKASYVTNAQPLEPDRGYDTQSAQHAPGPAIRPSWPDPPIFNVATQATFCLPAGEKSSITLNCAEMRQRFSFDPCSRQAKLLFETFGTNDLVTVTNAIGLLCGALSRDAVADAMTALTTSSNRVAAAVATSWPSGALRRRFVYPARR
jgi:hypothetical protein